MQLIQVAYGDGCGQEGSAVVVSITAHLEKPLTEDTVQSHE